VWQVESLSKKASGVIVDWSQFKQQQKVGTFWQLDKILLSLLLVSCYKKTANHVLLPSA
jgi:hypothetical protein